MVLYITLELKQYRGNDIQIPLLFVMCVKYFVLLPFFCYFWCNIVYILCAAICGSIMWHCKPSYVSRSGLFWLMATLLSSDLTLPRPDWFLASHPDVPRSDHQELRPGAEQAEGEDKQDGGGEGGSSQPEPGCQRPAQAASAQTGTGAANL